MSRTHRLSISDFVADFKNAEQRDEQALVISKAFEKVVEHQGVIEKEIKEEINFRDLVTKDYLADHLSGEFAKFELKIDKKISFAKWQVIGAMFVFFVAGIVAKHFGF